MLSTNFCQYATKLALYIFYILYSFDLEQGFLWRIMLLTQIKRAPKGNVLPGEHIKKFTEGGDVCHYFLEGRGWQSVVMCDLVHVWRKQK